MLFFSDCASYRNKGSAENEAWLCMIKASKKINKSTFMKSAENCPFEDESLASWLNTCEQEDSSTTYYKSELERSPVVYVNTSGFEFIYK